MVQTAYQQFAFRHHVLKAALQSYRDEDEGMATLEVVIIAGGLIAIALLLMAAITTFYSNHAASVSG